jgi:hypothetical protein
MTRNGKRELLEAIRPRYLRANTTEKTHILDQFVAITRYHRKYAVRLLKHGKKQQRRKKRGRSKVHKGEVISALSQVWEVCDRICSRRLHPFLPEIVAVLEREGELVLSEQTKGLLLHMSRASMDRCLQPVRYQRRRGRSTTKPGTLLKQAIPVRTFADWDDVRPGFVEIDLVAHCGDSAHGEYLHTLNVVDIATRWSECLILAIAANARGWRPWTACEPGCPFLCWALIGTTTRPSSTTTSTATANRSRSPSPARAPTRRMTRLTSSKGIGLSCGD